MANHAENIIKLRATLREIVAVDLIDNKNKDFYEATLIQILNESERQRQKCLAHSNNLRNQASVADGQAAAYGMISSIVNSVIDAFLSRAKRDVEELKEAEKPPPTKTRKSKKKAK